MDGTFVNPLSGQTHGGDEEVIPMTMKEIKDHEAHVDALFKAKEARIAALEAAVRRAIDDLRVTNPTNLEDRRGAITGRLRAVLDA